jgi:arylsulfatase
MFPCTGLLAALSAADATAHNVVGSPTGTISLASSQQPPAAMPVDGKIKDGALQSIPWWSPRVVPPTGPANVLLIITDDSGFVARAHSQESSRPKQWTRKPLTG